MSAATVLARGRYAAERDMLDTCTIQRPAAPAMDPNNAALTPTYSLIYSGICKIQGAAAASGTDIGEAHLAIDSPILHVPTSVLDVREADVVTVTASVLDADLVGRVFRVQGPHHKTYLTARRFQCTEVTS